MTLYAEEATILDYFKRVLLVIIHKIDRLRDLLYNREALEEKRNEQQFKTVFRWGKKGPSGDFRFYSSRNSVCSDGK